jgi:hypothetical protein
MVGRSAKDCNIDMYLVHICSSGKHVISLAATLYGPHRAWLGVRVVKVWVRGLG